MRKRISARKKQGAHLLGFASQRVARKHSSASNSTAVEFVHVVRINQLALDRECARKCASREKIRTAGRAAFTLAAQPLIASKKNAFGYDGLASGAYQDRETNLHYNYFRDYDPGIGRYVESDPIGLRAGPNTYAYVSLTPVKRVDLLGLVGDDLGNTQRPTFPGFVDPAISANRNIARRLQRWLDNLMEGNGNDGPTPPSTDDPIKFPDNVPYIPADLCPPDCKKTQITLQFWRRGIIADGMKIAEVAQFNDAVAVHNRICGLLFYVPPLLTGH